MFQCKSIVVIACSFDGKIHRYSKSPYLLMIGCDGIDTLLEPGSSSPAD